MILDDKKYIDKNINFVAGVDEVGRGPLCGPVVASAVIFPKGLIVEGINDSKKLSQKKREFLFDIIHKKALSIGIGVIHENKIDEINILEATILAMKDAVKKLTIRPDIILVDGNMRKFSDILQRNIIKGDSKSLCIAAASIIAKVTRDRMMLEYNKIFPGYGLSTNMGYGTKEHISAITRNLSTPIHRQSFNPISNYTPKFKDILDIRKLSIELAASKIVKMGHEIIRIKDDSLNYIDILSLFDEEYFGFRLFSHDEDMVENKSKMIKESELALKEDNIKKDITSSMNISVISVEFSQNKPKVIFKNI